VVVLTTYLVTPGLKTAALDGALLVFHPGSGATVALTDELLRVFLAIQQGSSDVASALTLPAAPTDDTDTADGLADTLDNCLRLLRQQQLIVLATV
jgi:hypothetical protein